MKIDRPSESDSPRDSPVNKLTEAKLRLVRYFVQCARENGHDWPQLTLEFPNLLAAADYCLERRDWQLLTELTSAINNYLVTTSWEDYIALNVPLMQNDLNVPAERIARLRQLSKLEMAWGHYDQAREYYEELWPIFKTVGDIPAAVETLQSIARLLSIPGKQDDAYQALEQGLLLAREYGYSEGEVELHYECALLFRKHDLARAQLHCAAAIATALSVRYLDKVVDSFILQASLFLDQYQFTNAERSATQGREIAAEMNDVKRSNQLNELIQDLKRRTGRNLFISYTHSDRVFVERLARDLRACGFPVWWDEWEIKVGDSIVQKVSEGIDTSAYLLAVLSTQSIKSNWVKTEIGSAMMSELSETRGITIIPLLLDHCDVPPLLRDRKWANFLNDYQTGLTSLLNKLVAD